MRATLSAVLLVAGGCASGPEPPAPFPEATTAHFVVSCHFPCGSAAEVGAEIGELALELVRELFGGEAADAPLRIHLYPAEDFGAVAREEAQGRFQENLAFTSPSEGVAHVGIEGGGPELGIADSRRVAHEAAHLSAARLAGGNLPDWLGEGLASWVEREVSAARASAASSERDPWLALHAWRALRLSDQGTLPDPAGIVGDSLGLPPAETYAVRSVFFQFLRRHRWETLDALLGAGADPSRRNAVLKRALTEDLGRDFAAWVAALADSVAWSEALPRLPAEDVSATPPGAASPRRARRPDHPSRRTRPGLRDRTRPAPPRP